MKWNSFVSKTCEILVSTNDPFPAPKTTLSWKLQRRVGLENTLFSFLHKTLFCVLQTPSSQFLVTRRSGRASEVSSFGKNIKYISLLGPFKDLFLLYSLAWVGYLTFSKEEIKYRWKIWTLKTLCPNISNLCRFLWDSWAQFFNCLLTRSLREKTLWTI